MIKSLVPKSNSQTPNYENVEEKADEFNSYFANVGREAFEKSQENANNNNNNNNRIKNQNLPLNSNNITNEYFRPNPVNMDTVILTMKQLNETNAFGSDGIPYRFIKDSLQDNIFYITLIVNTSL